MGLIYPSNPGLLGWCPFPPAAAEAAEDEHAAGLLWTAGKTTTSSGEITLTVASWMQHASNGNLLFSFYSVFASKNDINIDFTQNASVIDFKGDF